MNWKEQLKILEQTKEWDFAIDLMQQVTLENSDNLDAYLSINYLLVNLLVEEDCDNNKQDYYEELAKRYFNESYAKFSHNPEYLFYTGMTAVMSEWFFGIEREDYQKMLRNSRKIEPNNPLYQWSYYGSLDLNNPKHINEFYEYAKMVLQKNSPIKKKLQLKGSLGEYILMLITNSCKEVVNK